MINESRWPNTSLDLSHPVVAKAGSVSAVSSTAATIHEAGAGRKKSAPVASNKDKPVVM